MFNNFVLLPFVINYTLLSLPFPDFKIFKICLFACFALTEGTETGSFSWPSEGGTWISGHRGAWFSFCLKLQKQLSALPVCGPHPYFRSEYLHISSRSVCVYEGPVWGFLKIRKVLAAWKEKVESHSLDLSYWKHVPWTTSHLAKVLYLGVCSNSESWTPLLTWWLRTCILIWSTGLGGRGSDVSGA